jgi:hypothetical protein
MPWTDNSHVEQPSLDPKNIYTQVSTRDSRAAETAHLRHWYVERG